MLAVAASFNTTIGHLTEMSQRETSGRGLADCVAFAVLSELGVIFRKEQL